MPLKVSQVGITLLITNLKFSYQNKQFFFNLLKFCLKSEIASWSWGQTYVTRLFDTTTQNPISIGASCSLYSLRHLYKYDAPVVLEMVEMVLLCVRDRLMHKRTLTHGFLQHKIIWYIFRSKIANYNRIFKQFIWHYVRIRLNG